MTTSALPAEHPQAAEEPFARVDSLLGAGDVKAAIPLLEEMRKNDPARRGLDGRLGRAYYQQRDFRRAATHLKRELDRGSDDREVVQLLALSYISTGEASLAIPLLERLQSVKGSVEFDSTYLLGLCYLRAQQYDKARAAFGRMYSVPDDSATAHLLFARMLVREHLENDAMPELKKASALSPQLPMVHFLAGEIYLHQSQPKLAIEEFTKELEISPTVWLVYWRQGDAFLRLDDYARAETALKRAIWLNESFSAPYVLLGQVELKRGDPKLAVGFLERAARMDPNNYHAHYFLAQAYQQAGFPDKAREQFDAARALLGNKSSELLPSPGNQPVE